MRETKTNKCEDLFIQYGLCAQKVIETWVAGSFHNIMPATSSSTVLRRVEVAYKYLVYRYERMLFEGKKSFPWLKILSVSLLPCVWFDLVWFDLISWKCQTSARGFSVVVIIVSARIDRRLVVVSDTTGPISTGLLVIRPRRFRCTPWWNLNLSSLQISRISAHLLWSITSPSLSILASWRHPYPSMRFNAGSERRWCQDSDHSHPISRHACRSLTWLAYFINWELSSEAWSPVIPSSWHSDIRDMWRI